MSKKVGSAGLVLALLLMSSSVFIYFALSRSNPDYSPPDWLPSEGHDPFSDLYGGSTDPSDPEPTTPLPDSSFSVSGQYIKDNLGNTVRFTGVGFDASMIAQKYAAWGRDWHSDLMVQEGVNVVRIFVCYGWWTGEYTDYSFSVDRDTYRATIDGIVSDLNDADIYCWINMEGSYAKQQEWSLDSSNWISTLQEIALRYQDYPNMIGIEPQNEPNDWCWEDRYYARVQEVAHGIHEVAPNLLIFVDTPIHGWVNFDANFPIDEPNVVYCYHMYYRWQSVVETYRAGNFAQAKIALENGLVNSLYWLKEQGYPVMDTEFGVGRDEEFHPAFDVFLQDYFDIMKEHGIGWTYFHWDNDDREAQYDLWLEDWITPSPQGEVVFANLDGLIQSTSEPEPEPEPELPTETFGNEFVGSYSENHYATIAGSFFRGPESGVLYSINAYLKPLESGTLKAAMYKKSGNSLVAQSEGLQVQAGEEKWYSITFAAPKASLENVDYCLVVLSTMDVTYYYNFAEEGKGAYQEGYIAFPDPWLPFTDGREYSIYATVGVSG